MTRYPTVSTPVPARRPAARMTWVVTVLGGLLLIPATGWTANCDSSGNLRYLGKNASDTRSVWLSMTSPGSFQLEAAQGGQTVDSWTKSRRGLHLSISPSVSQGNGGTHKLYDVGGNKPCLLDTQNQKGGIIFPSPGNWPNFLRPPTGVMPTLPGGVQPPIGTLPPTGVMPTLPGGTQPPVGTLPPTGVMPTLPGGAQPPVGTLPPTGAMPTRPGGVQPPVGTLPPTGAMPTRPGGVQPPVGTLPPTGAMPTRPGGVQPPVGTLPPTGAMPTLPGGTQPPVGTLPPTGAMPTRPGGVQPPVGTLPPTGVMPTRPGGMQPPVGTLPPTGVMPTRPGGVQPPVGTLPPTGAMPTRPGGVQPPVGTLPPTGVKPDRPPEERAPIASGQGRYGGLTSPSVTCTRQRQTQSYDSAAERRIADCVQPGTSESPGPDETPITSGREFVGETSPWNVWVDANTTDLSDERHQLDLDGQTNSLTLGADRAMDEGFIAGLSLSAQSNELQGFDDDWRVSSDGITLKPYLAYRLSSEWVLNTGLGFTRLDTDNRIAILKGHSDATQYALNVDAYGQYELDESAWLRPKLSLYYAHTQNEAYTLSGSVNGLPVNVRLGSERFDYGTVEASGEMNWMHSVAGTPVMSYASVSANYAFERPNDGRILAGDFTEVSTSPWSGTVRFGARALLSRETLLEANLGYLSLGQNGLDVWEFRIFASRPY